MEQQQCTDNGIGINKHVNNNIIGTTGKLVITYKSNKNRAKTYKINTYNATNSIVRLI
jgi:hypothetical protein